MEERKKIKNSIVQNKIDLIKEREENVKRIRKD